MAILPWSFITLAALSLSHLPSAVSAQNTYGGDHNPFPIVDLGYELHQASAFNDTGAYYNFSNIRYAAPPLGNLRFAAPHAPHVNRSSVQQGLQGRICPQAHPAWENIAFDFVPRYLKGETVFNASSFKDVNASAEIPRDPRETEDCLFLDVMAPRILFEKAGKGYGAPVLVWIHGGGTTEGSKDITGNPAGLIDISQRNGMQGVVYVSMNYRLGALGWSAGPTFQSSGGTANAGLHDQRMALKWIQTHIHKFGGDPERVTVMGESAGGGSIELQITAFGARKQPFAQAISQSPGIYPWASNQAQEDALEGFLALLNVSSIDEARKLDSSIVQKASYDQIRAAPYGQYIYSEAVDGDFVPAMPGELLARGQFDKSIRVMVGHNSNEGLLFTPPFAQNDSGVEEHLLSMLPALRAFPKNVKYILETLYPPVSAATQARYNSSVARIDAIITELVFTCNTRYLDLAFNNETYSYLFSANGGVHGQDTLYTFYNGPSPNVESDVLAWNLQKYITNFAMTGNPNSDDVPFFPRYGSNATLHVLGVNGTYDKVDDAANERCEFWQKSLYF